MIIWNMLLTIIFIQVWWNNLTLRYDEQIVLWGVAIILAGTYWSIRDFRRIFKI